MPAFHFVLLKPLNHYTSPLNGKQKYNFLATIVEKRLLFISNLCL